MADELKKVLADKDLRPAYYDKFHCLAADCRFSCCKAWNITFDKKDYLSLKREKGSPELNGKLESGLRRVRNPISDITYGEFNMDSGVCPLLREDGLCDLQVERGHHALPFVCQSYPRSEGYTIAGYLEKSLSPSCEAVLELLWNLPEGIDFLSDPLPKEKHRNVLTTPDSTISLWFPVVREWCIDRLQDRRFSLPQRIWLMGLGLKELAEGETDIQRWMERSALLPDTVDMKEILPDGNRELAWFLSDNLRTLFNIPVDNLFASLKAELLNAINIGVKADSSFHVTYAPYLEARKQYEEHFGDHQFFMENLMVTIFQYLYLPWMSSREDLWKSYVSFCNVYSFYRFITVMSCREGASGDKAELFRLIVFASRALLHNKDRRTILQDELFQNNSSTLAHMAILLCG